MENKLTAQLGITPADAVAALKKYESVLSGTISSSNAAIRENGVSKYFESFAALMAPFGALENLCNDFGCTSTTQLTKKLEILSMNSDSDSEEAESVEAYFQVDTEWVKFLNQSDVLLAEDSKAIQTKLTSDINFVDIIVEEVNEVGTTELSIKDILSRSPLTWFIFLRHYS